MKMRDGRYDHTSECPPFLIKVLIKGERGRRGSERRTSVSHPMPGEFDGIDVYRTENHRV